MKVAKKKNLKRQFMGRVNTVGFENRKRRTNRLEIYAMIEIRLDRVKTVEEAEEQVNVLRKSILSKEVVFFAP